MLKAVRLLLIVKLFQPARGGLFTGWWVPFAIGARLTEDRFLSSTYPHQM